MLLTGAMLVVIAAIGLIDYRTPQTYSFSLFYLVPIVGAGWLLGRAPATIVGIASAAAWVSAEVAWGLHMPLAAMTWNAFTRVAIFVGAGLAAERVQRDRRRQRELLTRETTAHIATLEQLRHRDRLATVGKLASGLAHELGTPLNVVAGRAQLIATTPGLDGETVASARIIDEQSRRMTGIIRQLLDFARRRGPSTERIDLVELARRTLHLLGPLAQKRRIELDLEVTPGGPIAAEVDHAQLQQALTNLVMNGVQAMDEGGRLVVEVGAARVHPPEEHGGPEDEYAFLRVIDGGCGIAPDHVAQIFEPFFTTKPVGEGTGLGLSIAYGIVRDHGGWIGVQSEPGRGSRIAMYVPVRAVRREKEAAA